ncbi:alpha/beta hydrolase family protein [Paenibacillus alvei]|uniref:alpha/beta hydrolase family protein n=1 Tax=Paenibacillus alvei TaxID=44250 RepID=UPI0018CFE5AA|nr:alpha/beta hydrolase [Paenibacillus alvei]MBG9733516.1 alpha/beta hydrolase family protein [Paenibacillus alvei]MBG9742629.1 alpha/beta hydrolase family protein [Paenibacillus alvei]MCY9581560.1 alpha/beta hydrolase [Paenibacillus alvei]MCY9585433.1 alpha/beta hydrolase [Paenibacillus alvei]
MNTDEIKQPGYAGLRKVEISDNALSISFPMWIMFPTGTAEQTVQLGPYPIELASDAEVLEGTFPLVLISHGTGSTPFAYRMLAQHLARNGFIVGMPEHPFNNRNDNSLEGTMQNLANRPRHIRMAIDWFFENEGFAEKVIPNDVSVIGHSLGGYTALAAAGGEPTSFPHESPEGQPQRIEVTPDPRIQSLVLLAPASVWFQSEEALRMINIPILMLDAEKDPFTPAFHAQIIMNGVADRDKVQYRTVQNAGHFSFLSPFPASMVSPSFPPSQDPPGFDRIQFQEELYAEITRFLKSK